MKQFFITAALMAFSLTAMAQDYNVNRTPLHQKMLHLDRQQQRKLPKIDQYQTLACDFHIHTVFSDGEVWPTIRVKEAWQEGLDVIAITDHLTEKPYKKNVVGGPNTPYELAKPEADKLGVVLIHATEITRSKPTGGHLNALFITDAEKMLVEKTEDAVQAAVDQGGVIIWNHPGWAIDTCQMFDVNRKLIEQGKIHAVEVFNEAEWYPRALSWVTDFKLSPVAASDVHGLSRDQYRLSATEYRPVTLVFATDRSQEAIKKAILERRTLAYFNHSLAGETALLEKFFQASIDVQKVSSTEKNTLYMIDNNSEIPYELQLEDGSLLTLEANTNTKVELPIKTTSMKVNVRNLHTYEHKTLLTELKVK